MKTKLENILTKVQNPLTHKSVTEDKLLVASHDGRRPNDPAGEKPVSEKRAGGDKKWRLASKAKVRTHANKEGLDQDRSKSK